MGIRCLQRNHLRRTAGIEIGTAWNMTRSRRNRMRV